MSDRPLIRDCPLVTIDRTPPGMTAHLDPEGQIVFWDGCRQYHTGATKDDKQLRMAMRHHFGPARVDAERRRSRIIELIAKTPA